MSEKVVAVRKNSDGDIVELKLSSGRVIDYKQAQRMAQNGEIEGVHTLRGKRRRLAPSKQHRRKSKQRLRRLADLLRQKRKPRRWFPFSDTS